jgi:hypothetical protein
VMALSPLGKRRGGGSVVAAMTSQARQAKANSVFCREVESASRKSARKFNKLIG